VKVGESEAEVHGGRVPVSVTDRKLVSGTSISMEDGDSRRVKYEKIGLQFLGSATLVASTERTKSQTKVRK
jgi:hypothetical protein